MGRAPRWSAGPRGLGQANRPRCGLVHEPSLVCPMAGRVELWGAGDHPCCGMVGAGADGPGGLTWGSESWAGVGSPRGSRQAH